MRKYYTFSIVSKIIAQNYLKLEYPFSYVEKLHKFNMKQLKKDNLAYIKHYFSDVFFN